MVLKFGRIKQTQLIPNAKPVQVYRAFLNAKIHSQFTGSKATGKARIGSKFTAWDGYISGKTVGLTIGKRIVQEWRTTEFPDKYPSSILDLTFKAKKGDTQIFMIHSRVPRSQTARYREGWISSYWDPLREYFRETQKPKKR
jgi:activator of HSP90 ATPase